MEQSTNDDESDAMTPLSELSPAQMSTNGRMALAARALRMMQEEVKGLPPDVVAEKIDDRTGVGFEAAAEVAYTAYAARRGQ